MSMVRLTPLFLLALAVVPVIAADDKATVGDVRFEIKITGSDSNGLDITAFNRGKTEKKCKVHLDLADKNGKTQKWDYDFLASVRDLTQSVAGEADISGAPLSNPDLKASCD
jgi:hypothetical protein